MNLLVVSRLGDQGQQWNDESLLTTFEAKLVGKDVCLSHATQRRYSVALRLLHKY